MPGTRWFEGAELNYAENLLSGHEDGETAVLHCSELRDLAELSWGELRAQVAGHRGGSRGARCRPRRPRRGLHAEHPRDAGRASSRPLRSARSGRAPRRSSARVRVIDRFAQIEPKVFLAVDGYRHGGKDFDRTRRRGGHPRRAGNRRARRAAGIPRPGRRSRGARRACDLLAEPAGWRLARRPTLRFEQVPIRPPAVGALLLGHDRPAEGDRAGARRHPARAAQEAPAPRPAPRRSHVLVHDDGLDDVELPRRLPAQRGGDRALRRQPRDIRTWARCGGWPSARASRAWGSAPACSPRARRRGSSRPAKRT